MGAPGLYLLFLDEVRVVQFQDMGVTLHLAPQEILTRQMKSHLRLYQANPANGGQANGDRSSWDPAELAAGALTPKLVPGSSASWPFPSLLLLFSSLLSWLQFASSGLFTIWLLWFLI